MFSSEAVENFRPSLEPNAVYPNLFMLPSACHIWMTGTSM